MTITAVLAVLFAAAPATADWFPGDGHKMHWPQLPDLTPEGMDVLASLAVEPQPQPALKVLADDFRCTETGLITDIHIWGSWLNDFVPPEPDHGTFILGIYSDIPDPDGPGPEYSQPGDLLWNIQFKPGQYQVRLEATGPEQFYDPNIDQIIGQDNIAWQYNFLIDEPLAFQQEKDTIYWLSVANIDVNNDNFVDIQDLASVQLGENRFGWKTSRDHFNDDAVFIDDPDVWNQVVDLITPPAGTPGTALPWQEMRYPLGHPFETQSIDLAFVITPEPATLALLALGSLIMMRRK